MQLLGFPRTPMRATALVQTSPADTFFVLSAIERAGSAPRFWGQKMQRLLSIAVTLPDIGWTYTVQPMPFSAQNLFVGSKTALKVYATPECLRTFVAVGRITWKIV